MVVSGVIVAMLACTGAAMTVGGGGVTVLSCTGGVH